MYCNVSDFWVLNPSGGGTDERRDKKKHAAGSARAPGVVSPPPASPVRNFSLWEPENPAVQSQMSKNLDQFPKQARQTVCSG